MFDCSLLDKEPYTLDHFSFFGLESVAKLWLSCRRSQECSPQWSWHASLRWCANPTATARKPVTGWTLWYYRKIKKQGRQHATAVETMPKGNCSDLCCPPGVVATMRRDEPQGCWNTLDACGSLSVVARLRLTPQIPNSGLWWFLGIAVRHWQHENQTSRRGRGPTTTIEPLSHQIQQPTHWASPGYAYQAAVHLQEGLRQPLLQLNLQGFEFLGFAHCQTSLDLGVGFLVQLCSVFCANFV